MRAAYCAVVNGQDGEPRTHDLLLPRQALYQLSYAQSWSVVVRFQCPLLSRILGLLAARLWPNPLSPTTICLTRRWCLVADLAAAAPIRENQWGSRIVASVAPYLLVVRAVERHIS